MGIFVIGVLVVLGALFLVAVMPVTSVGTVVLGELVAGGFVTNSSEKWVGDLAAQRSAARAMKVIARCVVLVKLWLLL